MRTRPTKSLFLPPVSFIINICVEEDSSEEVQRTLLITAGAAIVRLIPGAEPVNKVLSIYWIDHMEADTGLHPRSECRFNF